MVHMLSWPGRGKRANHKGMCVSQGVRANTEPAPWGRCVGRLGKAMPQKGTWNCPQKGLRAVDSWVATDSSEHAHQHISKLYKALSGPVSEDAILLMLFPDGSLMDTCSLTQVMWTNSPALIRHGLPEAVYKPRAISPCT